MSEALAKGDPSNLQPTERTISGADLVDLMRQVLSRGKSIRFRARGGSMAPFIRDGDVIYISPFRKGEPGLGQVAAFLQPQTGGLLVHRVVGKNGLAYLIQGDNTPGKTDLVPPENLLGRVTQVERDGRQVRLGLGAERYLIALSSRSRLPVAVLCRTGSTLHMLFRNGKK